MRKGVAILCLGLLIWLPSRAESTEETQEEAEDPRREHHRHEVALFLGNTHDEGEDDFSIGVDYDYRLENLPMLGVGGLVEYTGGDADATIVAAALFFHPVGELRLLVAPGLEFADSEEEFLVRAGVAWEFDLGRVAITPQFNVDFVDGEEAQIYGVSFGWGF